MLRSTRNEFFIGFTLSVILSLFANFALLIRRYDLMMDSKLPGSSYAIEKYELWFSVLWFFTTPFRYFARPLWPTNSFRRRLNILVINAGINRNG